MVVPDHRNETWLFVSILFRSLVSVWWQVYHIRAHDSATLNAIATKYERKQPNYLTPASIDSLLGPPRRSF